VEKNVLRIKRKNENGILQCQFPILVDALGSYIAGAIYSRVGTSLTGSAVQGAIAAEYYKKTEAPNISAS